MNSGVLYISYSGMLEPLGQSQVLAYQERLAASRPIHLISFERSEDWENSADRDAVAERIRRAGISWHPLRYHKRPAVIATAWDIARGAILGWWLVWRNGLRIVHARSYISSVMALLIKRLTGASFVFDMRGFWADERVDGGLWPAGGRLYRVAKWFEKKFLESADHIVSLTHAAAKEIRKLARDDSQVTPISVIPTCADLERFVPRGGAPRNFVLGYVGSAGTWYLFEQVLCAFKLLRARRPNARLLIVNRNQHDYIRKCLSSAHLPPEWVELRSASHMEVPAIMSSMSAGIFFYKPSYSRVACSPTKLGEFLACGIPCLSNAGVGDMAAILQKEEVGVAVGAFEPGVLDAAIGRLLEIAEDPSARARCVRAARIHFSLAEGVKRYEAIYSALAS